ncbi:HAD-IC family P-type ATPase [Aeromicrobium sp.]|uniref:cation-translocating P-type ATPase n=1 Tax=Aeromicrobium sp. TaxID=1871063 RepID=UPI00198B9FC8|nr:HAD-IC family P-type ATPase [Aeromicrobium sp.]MBC7631597.1 HAD-IC family P-type ATPase [Aeromicrobium sp.]
MTVPGDSPTWHDLPIDESLAVLKTHLEGLTIEEARSRIEHYGPNAIARDEGPGWWTVLLRQFNSPLIYALLASAGVAFALSEVTNGSVVIAVVVLNSLIGFVQEYRAGKAINALAEMVSEPATALRSGEWTHVPAESLVPGDVVEMSPGDRVVADLRLLEGHGLRADESALTGESTPVDKTPPAVPAATALAERSSLLHAGTMVSAGTGHGLVVETGDRTELGRVSGLLQSADRSTTPLTRSIAHLGSVVTRAIGAVTVVLLGVALARGYPVADALLAAITLAVAAIPEGLPAIVTIALAIGVRRMAERRAIVRELPAVETLGATSVVCTDKTGTLTRNEMAVRSAWTPVGEVDFEGLGYAAEGRILQHGPPRPSVTSAVEQLLVSAVLANESQLSGLGEERHVLGDPTDGALLVAADRAGIDRHELVSRTVVDLLPFDADRRYMASVVETPDDHPDPMTYVKGAPELVLPHCDADLAGPAREALSRFTEDGLRVLAFARRRGAGMGVDSWVEPLELLGLIAMIDPPREGVAESIAVCRHAGVDVKMITGDHPGTASAIGRELGIVGSSPALTGPEIGLLDDDGLRERVGTTAVFARVAPEHKLRLVRALQSGGAVVAMTGDGVNDAPALRQADIGVAMGIAGTAAAKEAADIVLADDNFSTIGSAIEEGRRVYDNLVKALAFALPTNVGEGLVILVSVLSFPIIGGHPVLPIEPVQILWVNLVATVGLALPLALEAKEPGLMGRAPRNPHEALLSRFVVVRTIYVGVLLCGIAVALFLLSLRADGASLSGTQAPDAVSLVQAQTLAVTGLMFAQVFYLLMCRTLRAPVRTIGLASNPSVFVGIAVVIALQAAFVHVSFMQAVFGTSSLGPAQWAVAAAAGAVVVPVVALEKAWRQRRSSGGST